MSVEITLNYSEDRIVAVGVSGPAGPANTLSIGTVTTVAAGGSATASVTGSAPTQTLNLGIPTGATGATGPANTLSIGTVSTVAAGGSATASVTGTAPTQTLNLGIPTGATGATGPANTLSIGTVSTVAVGGSATASITGTAPTQTLNLGLPTGATGATGDWSTAQSLNAQTGASYTLTGTDPGKLVTLTNASAIALTVPTGIASVGQRIDLVQLGAGQVTVSGGSGVTINATPTAKLRTQYSAATLICIATTATPTATYLLVGDLAAN